MLPMVGVIARFFLLLSFLSISTALVHAQDEERIETRFGTVRIMEGPNPDDDSTIVALGYKKIKLEGHGGGAAGQYRLQNEDVIIVTTRSGGSGGVTNYYVISVTSADIQDKTVMDFHSADRTFKVQPFNDSLQFDLGYDSGKIKTATYYGGVLKVSQGTPVGRRQLSKDDCATVLEYAAECKLKDDCSLSEIMNTFSMNVIRNLNAIDNNPVFSVDKFRKICANICRSRTYSVIPVRKQLCGY